MANSTVHFTEREEEIIALLSQRYIEHNLDARIVTVNKLEGGQTPTLRFTLNDVSSTDMERERIANTATPVDDLAREIILELESPGRGIGP
jgi:hypothetical protein